MRLIDEIKGEINSASDRRFIDIMIRQAKRSHADLDAIKGLLKKNKIDEAIRLIDSYLDSENLSNGFLGGSKYAVSNDLLHQYSELPKRVRKLITHRAMQNIRSKNVTAATIHILSDLCAQEPFDLQYDIAAELFFCFRRRDPESVEIRDKILDFLLDPSKISVIINDGRLIKTIVLFCRSYFGERETGSYLSGMYSGLVKKEDWIHDMITVIKSLYIHPDTHPHFGIFQKELLNICEHRKREALNFFKPSNTTFHHPVLFNDEQNINKLEQVIDRLKID